MNAYAVWMFGLAFLYTVLLISVGVIARKKAAEGKGEGFFVGGRQFNRWTVAFCITGLFSGSTFISVLELSYLKGVSAAWYGVAELSHVLIIALILIGPFRKKMMVTISGLIGDKYGRAARGIAGAITAFTFPMWSVATALAFASAMHALTGLSLMTSVIITAILLLIYLQAGGMWSVAFTQTANFFAFMAMFIVGFIAFVLNPGFDGLSQLAASRPELYALDTVGLQTILAWFGTFWINVLLAQAAFQMALSCRTAEEGRKGLYIAAVFNIIFITMGVIIGLAATAVAPGISRGLVAVPEYLMQTLPAPLVGIFTLGIWACALGWGAPCQFSGATSLGRDTGTAIWPNATEDQQIRWTKISLVILTGLMIIYGLLRSEQAAWWNIFAWTARNGATFAPVVTALFWPVATKRGAVSALIAGFAVGLLWNHLGGWAVGSFYLNSHPVWAGMTANILAMTVVSLIDNSGNWQFTTNVAGNRKNIGFVGLIGAAIFIAAVVLKFNWLYKTGLHGMFLFLAVVGIWLAIMSFTVTNEQVETSQEATAQVS